MAITLDPSEYIAALGDLNPLVNDSMGGMQGVDILNQFAGGGGGSYNIPNGGFARPVATTDPTYSSGYDYARSIAGGMPMSQVIAPGVSYSPEQPSGYTQADLNIAAGMTPPPPPPPPVYQQPDDPSFFGTGIGGVTIPGGRRDKMPPLRNIFDNLGGGKSGPGYDSIGMPTVGNGPGFFDPNYSLDKLNIDKYRTKVPAEQEVQVPPQEFNIEQIRQDIADSGIDFTNLFGLPQAPDLSQFVTKDDLPNGRDFSVDQLNLPDFNEFALRKDLPVYQEPDLSGFARIEDLPTVPTFDRESLIRDIRSGIDIPKPPSIDRQSLIEDIRSGIELPAYQAPDLSGFARIEDLPTFNPDELRQDILMSLPEQKMQDLSGFMTQDDINKAIAGIDMPTYQAPDLSGFVTQADINKAISGINMPTYEQPDLSAYDTRIAELEQSLAALQQPTGGRFSVNQPQVRGLF